jgi:hypothetical protein
MITGNIVSCFGGGGQHSLKADINGGIAYKVRGSRQIPSWKLVPSKWLFIIPRLNEQWSVNITAYIVNDLVL